jgi:VanZ family protein
LLILKLIRIAAWTVAGAIVVLSIVPAQVRPETGLPHKLEHFLVFALSGLAFGLSYHAKRGLLTLQLGIFAACVEVVQLFVPGRHARLSDFFIDAIAIVFGSAIGALTRQFYPELAT